RPVGMVAARLLVLVSMRTTPSRLGTAAQTASGVASIPWGPLVGAEPRVTVAATLFVVGSMRESESLWWSATQTDPGATAMPPGAWPTGIVAMTWPVAGSSRVTVLFDQFVSQTPPSPTATAGASS